MRILLITQTFDKDNNYIVEEVTNLTPLSIDVVNGLKSSAFFYHNIDGLYIDPDRFNPEPDSDGDKILINFHLGCFINKL